MRTKSFRFRAADFASALSILSLALPSAAVDAPKKEISLRVMTYNIHSCKGRDRKIQPDRIARVIKAYRPDIVALQEVRVGRVDPGSIDRNAPAEDGVETPPVGESPLPPPEVISPRTPADTALTPVPFTNQPGAIADALGMSYVFYPLVRSPRQDYGIALLSRHPIRLVRAENLPLLKERKFSEKRGALWVEAMVDGVPVQIIATHLGLNGNERAIQMDTLLGPEWMGSEKFSAPFVVCGDLNAGPTQPPVKKLATVALDVAAAVKGAAAPRTWPSWKPLFRIDHVFVSLSAQAVSVDVPRTELTNVASDHLPLVADVVLR